MKTLMKLGFLALFVLSTGVQDIPIDWDSIGNQPTLSPEQATEMSRRVCEVTDGLIEKRKSEMEHVSYSDYFDALYEIDQIRDGFGGFMLGDSCLLELQRENSKYQLAMDKKDIGYVADNDLLRSRDEFKRKINPYSDGPQSEDVAEIKAALPGFLLWVLRTYVFWSLLTFLYALVFWEDEKGARVRVLVALASGFAHPVLLWRFFRTEVRSTFRAIWFETKVRQFQERALDPISEKVRAEIREFAHGNVSLREQKRRFKGLGLVAQHSFLLVLMTACLAAPIVSAFSFDNGHGESSVVIVDFDVGNSNVDVDMDTPLSGVLVHDTYEPVEMRLIAVLTDMVERPDAPPPEECLVVPRMFLVVISQTTTKQLWNNENSLHSPRDDRRDKCFCTNDQRSLSFC